MTLNYDEMLHRATRNALETLLKTSKQHERKVATFDEELLIWQRLKKAL